MRRVPTDADCVYSSFLCRGEGVYIYLHLIWIYLKSSVLSAALRRTYVQTRAHMRLLVCNNNVMPGGDESIGFVLVFVCNSIWNLKIESHSARQYRNNEFSSLAYLSSDYYYYDAGSTNIGKYISEYYLWNKRTQTELDAGCGGIRFYVHMILSNSQKSFTMSALWKMWGKNMTMSSHIHRKQYITTSHAHRNHSCLGRSVPCIVPVTFSSSHPPDILFVPPTICLRFVVRRLFVHSRRMKTV